MMTGKVVLVTGSGRGIGKAIATRFAEEGASVIINAAKSADEARSVLRGLLKKDTRQKHTFIKADVGDPSQIRAMMKSIGAHYRRLDILVNNAGITQFIEHNDLGKLTADIFDDIYRVNLRGPFLCAREAVSLLKKSDGAHIINIASIAAGTAIGSNIAYCAVKAGIVNMTKSLARALAPTIRVNAVSPGLTETDLIKGWNNYRDQQIAKTPLGRVANCDDVANAVFLLSTSLTYITGQEIVVDGGRTLA